MKKLRHLRKELGEELQFKVDVEGMPPTFMNGKSSAEILAKLRKIVKQPSMIKSVERYTDMEVKRAYKNKAQGRSMDEAANPEDKQSASPDEKSMAMKQAEFIEYAAKEIQDHLKKNKEFPEWMQNKLSKLHANTESMHSSLGAHGPTESTVNEISQDLKKRYADKAKSDYGHQQFSADIAREMGAKDSEKYYRRKQRNRMAGITKASK